ncbi:hypothetical protein LFL97_18965 [Burkholderia sp. JSH-S8]|uniref:hypothetical protein n=1 Tax=Burkholderia stagnalis TaxID=1503054 RepID=UPI000F808FC5|nr:hypothetical protein [Burkholderia stagnalis]WGS41770.1 hypothetical protein LFL97_18965 [Burkholderia sp. JSH-S8]
MKFKSIAEAVRKFAKQGIFPGPLAPHLGGGWIGILAGGAIRSLVVSAPYALALYLLGTWELFKWSVTAVGFLVYSILLEIDFSRQKQR